jgi:hypothetical protein
MPPQNSCEHTFGKSHAENVPFTSVVKGSHDGVETPCNRLRKSVQEKHSLGRRGGMLGHQMMEGTCIALVKAFMYPAVRCSADVEANDRTCLSLASPSTHSLGLLSF